jgi:hypothetical protein
MANCANITFMNSVNAISKVRFSSARPQRVHLLDLPSGAVDLLCLEKAQETGVTGAGTVLYIVTGSARVTDAKGTQDLSAGNLLVPEGDCTVANAAEQRLVCLRFETGG